jgi:hypothetical protein
MTQATRAHPATRATTLPNVERREIPYSIAHMPLSWAAGSGLMRSSGPPARHAHGSSFTLGRVLAGESAYLCCRDAEELFEVSGELVGAEVAVRGDDVLDGCPG